VEVIVRKSQTPVKRRNLATLERRRPRGLAWRPRRHWGRVWRRGSLDTVGRPPQSRRPGAPQRTPAMALGLTDHGWRAREESGLQGPPDPARTQETDARRARLLLPALPDQPPGRTPAPPAGKTTKKEAAPLPTAACEAR
jgi:hypothetical protein